MKWLALTDFKVNVAKNAKEGSLTTAWKQSNVLESWGKSAWAKKIAAKEVKSKSTDFERFNAKKAKQAQRKKVLKTLKIKA